MQNKKYLSQLGVIFSIFSLIGCQDNLQSSIKNPQPEPMNNLETPISSTS